MNSSYAVLAGADHLKCKMEKAMISDEMAVDIARLKDRFINQQLAPLISPPDFLFLGTQGISSDASASATLGWAAHAFGSIAYGAWTAGTRRLLRKGRVSINPLELLASAAAVLLLGKQGLVTNKQQVTLRGNNSTAFTAANTVVACTPAMRYALRTFISACQEVGVRCWVLQLSTKENRIADHASRMNLLAADKAIRE